MSHVCVYLLKMSDLNILTNSCCFWPYINTCFLLIYEQIERDTSGMLQCHPYPHEYADTSKPCAHSAFFMGLQRKEGVRGQEGQQFDIRGTVDEFRREIIMYVYWKPGMEIYVSHVRRKQLPAFVFPDGYKRTRMPRHINHAAEKMGDDTTKCNSGSSSSERSIKRKKNPEMMDVKPDKPEKRISVSPQRLECVSPESCTSKLGGTPQMSIECIEGVRLDGSTTNDTDNNCEIKSSDGLSGSGTIIDVGDMQINETSFVDSTHDRLKSRALEVQNEVRSLLNQRENLPFGSCLVHVKFLN